MIAPPFIANQLPAQLDDVRQIQVIPLDLAVALRDAVEARVEAAADVHHDRLRVTAEEIPGVAVHFAGEHDPHYLVRLGHRGLLDPVRVVADGSIRAQLLDQPHRFFILDQRVWALRFYRPVAKRDEQRFSDAAQSWKYFFGHF